MDLKKIAEIRERNRQAAEAEKAATLAEIEQGKAAIAKAQAFLEAKGHNFSNDMVHAVDLVLGCPGRALPKATVSKLNDIRRRHAALLGGK
jgi:hypothetical protein